jgi:hypothetical protein
VCISQFSLKDGGIRGSIDDKAIGSVQEKNEEKINREKHEICQLTSTLKDNKQELEFLKHVLN